MVLPKRSNDAGVERENLALYLAFWREVVFISSIAAQHFDRRVTILSRRLNKSRSDVYYDLDQDTYAMG